MSFLERFRKAPTQPTESLTPIGIEPNPNKPTPSPFLDARRSHVSMTGADVANKHMWQIVAVLALMVATAAVAGNVYHSAQSTMVPYVIQVDKLGQTAAVGPATWTSDSNPEVIQTFVAAWVANARFITPDPVLQKQAVFNLYAMLSPNDPATAKLNAYFGREGPGDPFSRAAKETVEVQIETALPISKDSWQVDWLETIHDRRAGQRDQVNRMRATLQVYQVSRDPKTKDDQMRRNPLRVFIKDYTWAKQLEPMGTK